MRRTCFYHAGCPDGFGAAWAVWRAWGEDARYQPRGHDDPLRARELEGQQVVFVDIAPRNDALRELGEVAAQVVILDHHLSARDHYASEPGVENGLSGGGHHICFDLNHSGAVLAWLYFHPGEPVPDLLSYVEDQDLWSWKLPHSEEVNAAIGSYPRSFETWEMLCSRPVDDLADEGEPIVRANRVEVEHSLRSVHAARLGNEPVEAVNSQHRRSALGHELAKRATYGRAWGMVYRLSGTRVDVSLYSIGDLDVSEVATRYGGGGHRNAAGFGVSLQEWLEHFV